MRLGYLHIGPPWHGIVRYGNLLATEARKRPELNIIEIAVELGDDRGHNLKLLQSAASQLSASEVIHIQFSYVNNKSLWGPNWDQLRYLRFFIRNCSSPIVVTLHDLHTPPPSFRAALSKFRDRQKIKKLESKNESGEQRTLSQKPLEQTMPGRLSVPSRPKGEISVRFFRFLRYLIRPNVLSLYWLLNQVELVLVCSKEEVKRLKFLDKVSKSICVPHFVEHRSTKIDRIEAKAILNLKEDKIITLLGFIHPIKGHRLMIEALPLLPENTKVIFAGGAKSPGQKKFVEELIALAAARGVHERLRITGYLSEQELEHYLLATDLAVCPFESMCASGSLSTWLSISRPILAYDLPQIAEYNALEAGAIHVFSSYKAITLAQSIEDLLAENPLEKTVAVERLRKCLSLPSTLDRHLVSYRRVLAHTEESESS